MLNVLSFIYVQLDRCVLCFEGEMSCLVGMDCFCELI
jgi:hypothetical protein